MTQEQVKNMLMNIMEGIVAHPDEVAIDIMNDEMGILYVVRVHVEDAGRIIGRNGEVADAIRRILRSIRMIPPCRASMKIDAPNKYNTEGVERI